MAVAVLPAATAVVLAAVTAVVVAVVVADALADAGATLDTAMSLSLGGGLLAAAVPSSDSLVRFAAVAAVAGVSESAARGRISPLSSLLCTP